MVEKIEVEEVVDDYAEEVFFSKASHESFTKKYDIGLLALNADNNNLHHINIVTPDDRRITSEIMTKFEYTRVIAERAKQIENGSTPFINTENETDPIKIAEQEIKAKQCPIQVKREITKNIIEVWRVNEMIPPFDVA
jgi:DNA-directed RNA polymerase subunit K/omega